MKIVLIGHPASQKIVPASKYLTSKYLPGFEVIYLNYEGPIDGWAPFIAGYLSSIKDKNIIFSLDDYLIADCFDMSKMFLAMHDIGGGDVMCVKLCKSTDQEHKEYPVTTQYTLWNREYLIWLLLQVKNPWEFEIKGSQIFNKKVILRTCIDYFTNSSLSARWEGVNLTGLKEDDINYLKGNNLL